MRVFCLRDIGVDDDYMLGYDLIFANAESYL
jgi:hypothetical protein